MRSKRQLGSECVVQGTHGPPLSTCCHIPSTRGQPHPPSSTSSHTHYITDTRASNIMPPHAPSGYNGSSSSKPLLPLRQPRPRRRVTMPQGAGTVAVQVKAPTMVRREENGGGRQSLCQGAGCFWNHVNHPFLSPSLPLGVPRSLGNPTDQKGKDVNEGGRGGRTRLPLVGLGLFDVLLLVATVVGVYQGHLADFWRDHYTE